MTPPDRSPARRWLALLAVFALATLGHTACCGCSTGPEGPRSDLEARYLPADPRVGDQPVPAGAEVTLRYELLNRGPEAAPRTSMHLGVPAGWRLVSVQCTAIGTAVCPPTSVTMDSGPVAVGSGFALTATMAPLSPARGGVSFDFVVAAPGDAELANNAVFVQRSVWSADRRVRYSAPAQAAAGDSVEWQLTIDNPGPDTAAVAPVARFPSGISPGPQVCRQQGGSVCLVDTVRGLLVPAGARTVVVFAVVIPPGFAGSITSTADDGLAGDPNPADNTATATLVVN